MATQMAETPTLYGNDARVLLAQLEKKPSKDDLMKLKSNLAQKFNGVTTERR